MVILCWITFGFLSNGLLNLMHEASHYHVFRHRRANDLLGRWFLGGLFLTDFDEYRKRHWSHHRDLGLQSDPKKAYQKNISGWGLFPALFQCLIFAEGLKRLLLQTQTSTKKKGKTWLFRVLIVQVFLFSFLFAFAALSGPDPLFRAFLSYVFVYGYGFTTLLVFVAMTRGFAEHHRTENDSFISHGAALRNLKCNFVSRLIWGGYGFEFHATHHDHPGEPAYHLKKITSELCETEKKYLPQGGYVTFSLKGRASGRH